MTINIDDLTIGQVKQLQSLLSLETQPVNKSAIASRYIGKKVIIRSYSAGNHYGELVDYDIAHQTVVLKNSRRLWRWNTDKGISLSEIAIYGVVQENSRITSVVPEQIVSEVDEIILTTADSQKSIESAPVYIP
jgi:hypothetical protein